mmetsp:Transcript_41082/g.64161  ORF Transcript_41082/g.64161 Transcript_41082/m.64161 type:complete len:285 (+) Transcript_41082:402-1256(+)|eukprot:CAMPEP_0184300474 /NCGR_PEP_ID=MMETSP1049-20130417/10874_1 /TAXON_ID=77928 /ORGANISM="Proteomonas sulcata, Strain CCMP704" /LENGTH=284 /DNA_ID=CAMNT_0026611199 /DNA_START=424 /DNA_END=1278 /DNA_ORIENTATION=+
MRVSETPQPRNLVQGAQESEDCAKDLGSLVPEASAMDAVDPFDPLLHASSELPEDKPRDPRDGEGEKPEEPKEEKVLKVYLQQPGGTTVDVRLVSVGRIYGRGMFKKDVIEWPKDSGIHYYFEENLDRGQEVHEESFIGFFLNGEYQGTAFSGLGAGTYYPAASVFMGGQVTYNFGPKFKFEIDWEALGLPTPLSVVDLLPPALPKGKVAQNLPKGGHGAETGSSHSLSSSLAPQAATMSQPGSLTPQSQMYSHPEAGAPAAMPLEPDSEDPELIQHQGVPVLE